MRTVRTVRLDQLIDSTGVTVEVRLAADGSVAGAWFAMDGLPRIEPLLRGRPVVDVPGIVERVCGICPVAHHLAGVRALETLLGTPHITPTADAIRRLLHHGAVLQTHAQQLAGLDAAWARELGGFARAVVAAAGADSHFPRCAVPGGVLTPLPGARRDALLSQVAEALERALLLLRRVESEKRGEAAVTTYAGHDVALVDEHGALDLYGDRLRAVAPDGSVTVDSAAAADWTTLVAESRPEDPAPRPYLRALGAEAGGYRVGPVAQLRAPTALGTPLAESARRRWSAAGGDAAWARVVVTLHVVEVIAGLLRRPELVAGPVLVEAVVPSPVRTEASGWVDGARGLLVHTYRADGASLSGAVITTPTAQNETWLADQLLCAVRAHGPLDPAGGPPDLLRASCEAAVRTADPCLPCTLLPVGQMPVRLRLSNVDARPLASWLLKAATDSGASDALSGRA